MILRRRRKLPNPVAGTPAGSLGRPHRTLDSVVARYALTVMLLTSGLSSGQDGVAIADDPAMFSERFRVEFREMNETFADFGFELDVIEGERPSLAAIIDKYGDADREDEVEVIIGFGPGETRETLTFHYFRDVGFGVRPADPEQLVLVVKRREG